VQQQLRKTLAEAHLGAQAGAGAFNGLLAGRLQQQLDEHGVQQAL
jgi:hypothetical protein